MSEPEVTVRFKRGDVRQDGRVFWGYHQGSREYWLDQEKFDRKMKGAKEANRKWRGLNSVKILENNRKWKKANPDKVRESERKRVKANPDKKREENRKWRRENPDRVRNIIRKSKEKRAATNPNYKLSCRLRSRIYNAFRRANAKKLSDTENILGATVAETKAHIEAQFQPGMSWENYGDWHVDHIIPLASAKTAEDLVALCHHLNLQPLWASDNRAKWAKMPHELKKEKA